MTHEAVPRCLSTKALPVKELIVTAEVARLMLDERLDPLPSLRRHLADDWGELTEQEHRDNLQAVLHGGEIFSSYPAGDGLVLWIVSEWDRSVTTLLLLPEN